MQFNRYARGAIRPRCAPPASPIDRGLPSMRKLVVAAALAALALPAHLHAQPAPPPTLLSQPEPTTPKPPGPPPPAHAPFHRPGGGAVPRPQRLQRLVRPGRRRPRRDDQPRRVPG